RDLAGVRPFYYYSDDSRLVFASDLPAVAAAAGMSRQLNKMYSSGWAQRSILANDETAYAGIFRLPAAHVIVITRDKKRTWAWWTPDQVTELDLPDENQYAERLQQLLYQAVTCRLQAPCQVGAHLGGGLSSSSVAVIAARRLRSQGRELVAIHGLHKTAEEVPGDERQNVETICSQEGIDCHYAQPIDVYDAAFTRIRHSGDRPPGILLRERRVRETARQQGAHVLLTGLGGQGIVSNSGCFDEELLRGNLLGFWKMLRQYKQLRKGLTISFFIRKSMYGRRLRKLRKWVRSGFKAPSKPKPPIGLLNSPQVWQASFLDRQQPSSRAPQKSLGAGKVVGVRTAQIRKLTGLVSHLEGWTASGRQDQIEYRYPLLDRRVIEFALSIPGNLYLHNGFSKWIFRESLGGILPDSIRWHTGLGKPALQLDRTRINREFSRDLMQPLLRQLLTENWDWQCLDPQAARQIVEAAGRAELPDGSWWSAPLQALNVEMFFNHQLHESVSEQLQNRTIGKKVSRARAA
ncbi:MAG: asparagine synthase-related protein, partial [Planctomycetales bacterium]